MKISFVIPAYNEEHYLEQCLELIIREKRTAPCDIEIIAVNNASTDRTREIIMRYPDVTLIDEPRKGLVWARRAGYIASHGDIIANVDADTRLPPGWIRKAAEEFSAHPGLVALSGPFVYYDLSRIHNMATALYYRGAMLLYFLNKHVFRTSSMLQGGNFVIRRAALERIGGYDTSITFYGEDTDLARRLNKVGDVKFELSFYIYSSGRRLAGEGIVSTVWHYVVNYTWVIATGHPFHETYTDVRYPQKK